MKTDALLAMQQLRQIMGQLQELGLQPAWDAASASLSFASRSPVVERIFLRLSTTDNLVQLALITKLRCQPESTHKEAALRLMRLSATSPFPGWLLDEKSGAIYLRVVMLHVPTPLDFAPVLKTIVISETLINAVEAQLTRIATGHPDPPPLQEAKPAQTAEQVFKSFSE